MALKFQKHTETKYTFTGRDFAKACYDADINAYRMEKMTGGHIYHGKGKTGFRSWIAKGDELIEVDKFTLNLLFEVLEASSKHSKPQEASNK